MMKINPRSSHKVMPLKGHHDSTHVEKPDFISKKMVCIMLGGARERINTFSGESIEKSALILVMKVVFCSSLKKEPHASKTTCVQP